MSATAADTQEDKRGHIGPENIYGVPIGRTATAAPTAPTPSLAEERPTKKRPAQIIGHNIVGKAKMSLRAVSDTVFQRRTAAAATTGSRHRYGK